MRIKEMAWNQFLKMIRVLPCLMYTINRYIQMIEQLNSIFVLIFLFIQELRMQSIWGL